MCIQPVSLQRGAPIHGRCLFIARLCESRYRIHGRLSRRVSDLIAFRPTNEVGIDQLPGRVIDVVANVFPDLSARVGCMVRDLPGARARALAIDVKCQANRSPPPTEMTVAPAGFLTERGKTITHPSEE